MVSGWSFLWAQQQQSQRSRIGHCPFFFCEGYWRVKAKLSALKPRTWCLTNTGTVLYFWEIYLCVWGTQIPQSLTEIAKKEIWIEHVSLASWGALITPMSYPNWKEPSTAVKTVKTKVPVICGEWNTGLGNTRQFPLPTVLSVCSLDFWQAPQAGSCSLVLIHSVPYAPNRGHSYGNVRGIHQRPYVKLRKVWGNFS